MSSAILFVDDDALVLDAFRRNLSKRYEVHTATGPVEGIESLRRHAHAVVVSDLRMPAMSGIEFLTRVKEFAPETVRILLTGHADLDAAISAVNDGNLFRFLTKPCDLQLLSRTLDAALEQHRLIIAERELLQETLMGTVRLLTEILSAVQPLAFGRTSRIRVYVERIAQEMGLNLWELDAAACLSQLGCISIPSSTLAKYCSEQTLTPEEASQIQCHPYAAGRLLRTVPRLHTVAEIVERQLQASEIIAGPQPENFGIVAAAQILRAAHDLDRYFRQGQSWEEAILAMRQNSFNYGLPVLAALDRLTDDRPGHSESRGPGGTARQTDDEAFRSIADEILRHLRVPKDQPVPTEA